MAGKESGTLVTFDYESNWGMPHDVPYDLHESTRIILDILRRNEVHAMFFVLGRLVEEESELIALIAQGGHAIGIHGYHHERIDVLSANALSSLQNELDTVCMQIKQITGSTPIAFRAPYLLWPNFVDPAITAMLAELGFLWMSNRHIRFAEELFLPTRFPKPLAKNVASSLGVLSDRRILGSMTLATLNMQFLRHDSALGSSTKRLRWLLGAREPFERSGLVEVAIGAPLECDLLGLPVPSEKTSDSDLKFATDCLIRGRQRRGNPYVLTFHDWIIGTGNRPALLDNVLSALGSEGPMLNAQSWMPETGNQVV
jgi:peptidoglycan/xylan/chitin deacetylase (PgdA/CDA1 family)